MFLITLIIGAVVTLTAIFSITFIPNKTILVWVFAVFTIVCVSVALNELIKSGYHVMQIGNQRREFQKLASLLPDEITPGFLQGRANLNGYEYRRYPAKNHDYSPDGSEVACNYSGLTFFFDKNGKFLEIHGHMISHNPIYKK